MPGTGFIRVKLLQVEKGDSMKSENEMFDPYVAINVKESVNTPGKIIFCFLVHCIDNIISLPTYDDGSSGWNPTRAM